MDYQTSTPYFKQAKENKVWLASSSLQHLQLLNVERQPGQINLGFANIQGKDISQPISSSTRNQRRRGAKNHFWGDRSHHLLNMVPWLFQTFTFFAVVCNTMGYEGNSARSKSRKGTHLNTGCHRHFVSVSKVVICEEKTLLKRKHTLKRRQILRKASQISKHWLLSVVRS